MPDPSFIAQQQAQQAAQQAHRAHQQAHHQAMQHHMNHVHQAGHRPPPTHGGTSYRGRGGGILSFLVVAVVAVALARDTALRDSILGSIEHLWTSVRNK